MPRSTRPARRPKPVPSRKPPPARWRHRPAGRRRRSSRRWRRASAPWSAAARTGDGRSVPVVWPAGLWRVILALERVSTPCPGNVNVTFQRYQSVTLVCAPANLRKCNVFPLNRRFDLPARFPRFRLPSVTSVAGLSRSPGALRHRCSALRRHRWLSRGLRVRRSRSPWPPRRPPLRRSGYRLPFGADPRCNRPAPPSRRSRIHGSRLSGAVWPNEVLRRPIAGQQSRDR